MGSVCTLALALAAGSAARGDDSSQASATAEALFRDGRILMEQRRYDEACPKFVAAQKLEATVGTALNKGECFERAGKLASAWAGFDEARALAKRAGEIPRADEAARRMGLLEPRLSKVLIQAPSGGLPAGSVIKLDGQAVDAAALGTAIPVDAGLHRVEVAGPAGASWSTTVEVPADPVTMPVLLQVPVAPPSVGDLAPASAWGALRISGVAIGSAGVVSAIVGAIFGGVAISKKNASNANGHCTAADYCDPTGLALRADGLTAGTVSTATLIAGGIAVAGGLTLALTAPSAARTSPSVTEGRVGLMVGMGSVRIEGRW